MLIVSRSQDFISVFPGGFNLQLNTKFGHNRLKSSFIVYRGSLMRHKLIPEKGRKVGRMQEGLLLAGGDAYSRLSGPDYYSH